MSVKIPRAFYRLTITATNAKFNVKVAGVTYNGTLTVGATYDDPTTLCAAFVTALTAAISNAWTCTFNSATGIVTVGGGAFQLLFSTGADAANSCRNIFGFGAVDTALATSAVSTNQHQNGWYANRGVARDSGDRRKSYTRSQTVALSGRGKSLQWGKRTVREVSLIFLNDYKAFTADEGSTHLNESFERLIDVGNTRFRWWSDQTVPGTYGDYYLDQDSQKEVPFNRATVAKALYGFPLLFRALV